MKIAIEEESGYKSCHARHKWSLNNDNKKKKNRKKDFMGKKQENQQQSKPVFLTEFMVW